MVYSPVNAVVTGRPLAWEPAILGALHVPVSASDFESTLGSSVFLRHHIENPGACMASQARRSGAMISHGINGYAWLFSARETLQGDNLVRWLSWKQFRSLAKR